MIEAAKNGGLIDSTSPSEYDFKLILEPEAAAAFCLKNSLDLKDNIKEGDTFLVDMENK
jgi:hypothetical protein